MWVSGISEKNLDRVTLTIDELTILFFESMIVYDAKDGKPTSEVGYCRVFAVTGLMSLPPNCSDCYNSGVR